MARHAAGVSAVRAAWLLAGASPLRPSVTFCLSPHLLNLQLWSHGTRQFHASRHGHLRHHRQGRFLGTACIRSRNRCDLPSCWAIEEKLLERRSNGWLRAEKKKQEPLANAVVGAHRCPAAQVVQNASYGATARICDGGKGQQSGSGLSSLYFRGTKGIERNPFNGGSGLKAHQHHNLREDGP